ncbi:MAG TPA: GTP cyclohydrolase FolE2 [Burkholderiaceae bacterium]|nr:GTP cyclohydrolase FolE2 [Burkholderiaceae bacterium]
MNVRDTVFLPDVQSAADVRDVAIQRVGIRSLRLPVTVATPDGPQPSIATVGMFVMLPADKKGTHMSRFIDVVQQHGEPLSPASMRTLMAAMLERLEASEGMIELRMPYFMRKSAPISRVASLMDYELTLRAEHDGTAVRVTQEVVVPVTSLCPCSKKIADYGAHNQRSHVTIGAVLREDVSVEDLVRVAEESASCEVWGMLKRIDEKYVTERAYDNPKFVEDIVRDVALRLRGDARIAAFRVECENFESIHNHSAYARIDRDGPAAAR